MSMRVRQNMIPPRVQCLHVPSAPFDKGETHLQHGPGDSDCPLAFGRHCAIPLNPHYDSNFTGDNEGPERLNNTCEAPRPLRKCSVGLESVSVSLQDPGLQQPGGGQCQGPWGPAGLVTA